MTLLERKAELAFLIGSLAGGGAERMLIELLSALAGEGYRLSLTLNEQRGELLNQVPPGVALESLNGAASGKRIIGGAVAIRELVARRKPAALISNLLMMNCVTARSTLLGGKRCGILLVEQNNLSSNLRGLNRAQAAFLEAHVRKLYTRTDGVVAVSDGVKRDLVENYGLPDEFVHVIHNPINIERVRAASLEAVDLPWQDDAPVLVAAGRMIPQKAHADLVAAFKLIREQIRAHLVILGDGPLRGEIERQVSAAGLQADVHMPGFVSNPWRYFHRADLYLSSSKWEGFSVAHLEAMAVGTPVVHTDCDFGPREVITSSNGLLVPVGDPAAMAAGVLNLLDDSSRRTTISEAARADVARFDIARIAESYERLLARIAA